jgi:predicted flap endonuclease-1-like 5' DNA nuclease
VESILTGLALLVAGFVSAFFGYRLFRILLPIYGGIAGFMLAWGWLGQNAWFLALIVGVVLAVVLGILAYTIWSILIGLGGIVFGVTIAALIATTLGLGTWLAVILAVVLAAVFGFLFVVIRNPMVMIVTAIAGGAAVARGIGELLGLQSGLDKASTSNPTWLVLLLAVVFVVVAVVGGLFQWRRYRRKMLEAPKPSIDSMTPATRSTSIPAAGPAAAAPVAAPAVAAAAVVATEARADEVATATEEAAPVAEAAVVAEAVEQAEPAQAEEPPAAAEPVAAVAEAAAPEAAVVAAAGGAVAVEAAQADEVAAEPAVAEPALAEPAVAVEEAAPVAEAAVAVEAASKADDAAAEAPAVTAEAAEPVAEVAAEAEPITPEVAEAPAEALGVAGEAVAADSLAEPGAAAVVAAAAAANKVEEPLPVAAAADKPPADAGAEDANIVDEVVKEIEDTYSLDDIAKFKEKLEYVEGVGPAYAEKLLAAGIRNVLDLLQKGATRKGRAELVEATGISGKLILRWVNHADLYRVKGIGSEYADLLEAAGVDTVPELATRNPANLFNAVTETNKVRKLVRKEPVASQIEDWVSQAKKLPRVIQY